jgi:timeless
MASSEPNTERPSQQAIHMQQVCEAFLAQDALAVIVGMLAEPLSRHPKMTDKDTALVELVITFLRNLLVATVPPADASNLAEEAGRRIRTGLIERLFADDVLDLVLLMAQHARERPFKSQASVLLDLFLHLFTDVTPQGLLSAESTLKKMQNDSKHAPDRKKKAVLLQRQQRPLGVAPVMPTGSTSKTVINKGPSRTQYAAAVYMRRHLDHGSGVLVRHAPAVQELPGIEAITNPKHKKAQTRNVGAGNTTEASAFRSMGGSSAISGMEAYSIRSAKLAIKLDEYLAHFLEEAYTPLVGQVFKDARAGLGVSMMEEEDFEKFARFVALCTQYARLREESRLKEKIAMMTLNAKNAENNTCLEDDAQGGGHKEADEDSDRSPFECLNSTMGWDAFHMLLILLQVARDRELGRARDKILNKIPRRHVLLNSLGPLLREMLLTLDLARVAGNSADRHAADRLQRRLVFDDSKDSGIVEILTRTIRDFSYSAHSRGHAVNMVEVLHLILGMLDRLTKDPGGLVVRQKIIQRASAKRASTGGGGTPVMPVTEEDALAAVDAATAGAVVTNLGKEGAKADEEGQPERSQPAVEAGQEKMVVDGDAEVAEKQQDNGEETGVDTIMAADIEGEKEDAPIEKEKPEEEKETSLSPAAAAAPAPAAVENPEEEGDEDAEQPPSILPRMYRDIQFDLQARLRKVCAIPAILQFYTWLLQGYKSNAPLTNAAITSFFTRIALPLEKGGLGLEAMLWQLSVLRVFHAIMSDASARKNPMMADLIKLCTRITRNLFSRLAPAEPEPFESPSPAAGNKTTAAGHAAEVVNLIGDDGEEEQQAKEGDIRVEEEERKDEDEESADAKKKKQMTELEPKMKHGAASLGFIELLFWKTANIAEVVSEEYNWKKLVDMHHSGSGGISGPSGGGQLGFASYRGGGGGGARASDFTEEQTNQLIVAFEKCNGQKDCLDLLVDEFGGTFKRNHISKKMKDLGLYRGKFTYNQQDKMKSLMEVHAEKAPKAKFMAIAEDLGAGFTANQVRNKLKDMGLVLGGGGNGGGNAARNRGDSKGKSKADAWDAMLGSENDADDDNQGGDARPTSDSDSEQEAASDSDNDNGGGERNRNKSASPPPPSFDEVMLGIEYVQNHRAAGQSSGQKRHAPEDAEKVMDDANEEDESAAAENRRAAALALLRKKHKKSGDALGVAAATAGDGHGGNGDVPAPDAAVEEERKEELQELEDSDDDDDDVLKEKVNVPAPAAAEPVKTFGRGRLKKLGGGTRGGDEAAGPPMPSIFDDLEDF